MCQFILRFRPFNRTKHFELPTRTQPNLKGTGSTHTRQLDTAVTALGSSALLLQVEITELAAGGLDDTDLVGPRVVPVGIRQYLQM